MTLAEGATTLDVAVHSLRVDMAPTATPTTAPSQAPTATPTVTPTVRPDTDPTTEDTDDEGRLAHIGRAGDVSRAYVTGEMIEALCGKRFVPTRDPNRYPVCPRCSAILRGIKAGRGGAN